ncbi:MAG: 3-dehydroquinate synthase [Bacteroidales bacterium]|nr:3-dehydroquinate synthase [Bacteroidales bacterium]
MAFLDKIYFRSSTEELRSILQDKKVFVIIDKQVEKLYGTFFPFPKVFIDANEDIKNLATVQSVIDQFMKMGADSDCFILGIGGGIVTDLTSFVAAIYRRGVKYALIPTTLLAQVDAAIGGKTGINSSGFRNVVGVFNKPQFVYVCSLFLKTLDEKNMLSGAAEMLKLGIIGDSTLYRKAVAYFKENHLMDYDTKEDLDMLIMRAVKNKCKIVEKDYHEHGPRRVLNLGHTFAHAIEKCSAAPISHGNAVSIGTVMAARIGEKLGKTSPKVVESLIADFTAIGLPTATDIDVRTLLEAVSKDRKRVDNTYDMVIPTKIGSVDIVHIGIDDLRQLVLSM